MPCSFAENNIVVCHEAKGHHLDEPLVANDPPSGEVLSNGSTAIVTRIGDGLVLKSPRYSWWHLSTESTHDLVKDMKKSFRAEEQIFQILGVHPRIVQYVIQFTAFNHGF